MAQKSTSSVLIDYSAGTQTPHVNYAARLPLGGVTFSRSIYPPNPGVTLGSTQAIVAVHNPPSFEMEWRDPDRDSLRQRVIHPGQMSINRADLPVFHRWHETANALVIALDDRLIMQTVTQAFDCDTRPLRVAIGITDPVIQKLAALGDREISEAGASGRLYAECLATALIIHLFRSYGAGRDRLAIFKGGLSAVHLRRVKDYVDSHLDGDIGLAELATLTGLSTHHFGQAFKASTGVPPHRYLIDRRIRRAKDLLAGGDLPITGVALAAGFSSQSHMTFNFRKLAGTTPARYRKENRPPCASILSNARRR